MEPLRDTFGRPLETLRISITDRCNFRCVYCMPKEVFGRDYAFLDRSQLLSLEEIARVAGIFAQLGVRTVRITGGEPLVRRNVEHLVELLAQIPEIELALTTNGALLPQKAAALAQAGLDRITALAEHFRGTGHVLRFIEYMDVGHSNGWRLDDVVPAAEIVERIGAVWPLEPVAPARPDETSRRWRYRDGAGEIGVIASVTEPFCGGCSRARLSAEGQLFTCLFAVKGHDLRAPLRAGASDEELAAAIRAVWTPRTDRYSELRTADTAGLPKVEMSYIGG